MTYSVDLEHLPKDVQEAVPLHAQMVFAEAFNAALDETIEAPELWYEREAATRRKAWAAVKRIYWKNERTGAWRRRGYHLPSIASEEIPSRLR